MAIHKFPVRIAVEGFASAEVEIDSESPVSKWSRASQAKLNLTTKGGERIVLAFLMSIEAVESLIASGGFPATDVICDLGLNPQFTREK